MLSMEEVDLARVWVVGGPASEASQFLCPKSVFHHILRRKSNFGDDAEADGENDVCIINDDKWSYSVIA